MSIREFVRSRPLLGWGLAALLLIVATLAVLRSLGGSSGPYSFDRLTEDVVIRDRVTGEEWTIKRGRLEAMLWEREGALDPSVGLPNPKTGTLTGFPRSDWEATVERINRDREATARAYGRKVGTSQGGK